MRNRIVVVAAFAAIALTASFALAGGRARVQVGKVPATVEAGKPFELAIQVVPETWSHARNVEPLITAECGGRKVTTAAVALEKANRYKATLTLPSAGAWKIRVDSRFCHTVMSPVSIRAVAAAVPEAEKKSAS